MNSTEKKEERKGLLKARRNKDLESLPEIFSDCLLWRGNFTNSHFSSIARYRDVEDNERNQMPNLLGFDSSYWPFNLL